MVVNQPEGSPRTVTDDGSQLQRRFLALLAESVDRVDLRALHLSWETQTARTALYGKVLSDVAMAMGLQLEPELLVVDFALIGADDRVPKVFIESENIATSAVQEVRKLSCLAAPLKVLLAVCEWDEAPEVWPHGSPRSGLLDAWRREVALHAAAGSLVGSIVAVVAEWRDDHFLRLYAVDLRNSGAPDEMIVNRNVLAPTA